MKYLRTFVIICFALTLLNALADMIMVYHMPYLDGATPPTPPSWFPSWLHYLGPVATFILVAAEYPILLILRAAPRLSQRVSELPCGFRPVVIGLTALMFTGFHLLTSRIRNKGRISNNPSETIQ